MRSIQAALYLQGGTAYTAWPYCKSTQSQRPVVWPHCKGTQSQRPVVWPHCKSAQSLRPVLWPHGKSTQSQRPVGLASWQEHTVTEACGFGLTARAHSHRGLWYWPHCKSTQSQRPVVSPHCKSAQSQRPAVWPHCKGTQSQRPVVWPTAGSWARDNGHASIRAEGAGRECQGL